MGDSSTPDGVVKLKKQETIEVIKRYRQRERERKRNKTKQHKVSIVYETERHRGRLHLLLLTTRQYDLIHYIEPLHIPHTAHNKIGRKTTL